MRSKYLGMLIVGCAIIGLAQPSFADTANAPNAYFMFGGNIFENGQSNNLGPAANIVLSEGMYWFSGDCPNDDGSTEDCDLLRFGAGFHPKECNDGSAAEINHFLPAREDGGQAIQDNLARIQSISPSPYCDSDPAYRPLDEILIDHQDTIFEDTYDDDDSPWVRPNLNLMVISDLPQTTDRNQLSGYEADARAKRTLASTCQLLYGEDEHGVQNRPAMPTWVMMARQFSSDAAGYGGLLAAAGGTGQCCYDEDYDPNDHRSVPCNPTQPAEVINLCEELPGFSETEIRRGVADGKFQCAPGGSEVQTGSMDFGTRSRGTLPHILCHFAGSNGHNNCTGPQADRNKRRPTDVLGKMACIRQVPQDYDGGPLRICDRYGDCRTLDVCEEDDPDCSGVQFIDPNETLFTLVGDHDGQLLCGELADGGEVVVGCPNVGEDCTVDGAEGRCRPGTVICENGKSVCEPKYEAMPEICNGLDDDCDGRVDNLSDSWDDFSENPDNLSSYDSDGVNREAIHCFEKDVCRCPGGATLDYGGPDYEDHIMSWEPGTCQCGEGIGEDLDSTSGGFTPAPDTQPQAGCSSVAAGGAVGGLLWWMIFGVLLWRRRT